MSSKTHKQQGTHLVVILCIVGVIAVAGALGYVFWNNFGGGSETPEQAAIKEASKELEEECKKTADDDICKFLSNWNLDEAYRIVTVSSDGTRSMLAVDKENTHMTLTGEMAYEVIRIDNATYTKAGDTWYKQVDPEVDEEVAEGTEPIDFAEPTDDEEAEAEDKTVYKFITKEACGDLMCFKYEVTTTDSEGVVSTETLWFDDKEYKARKIVYTTEEGTTESTFEYDGVNVEEPSPVEELAADEYIMPGATEPTKMPTGYEGM